MNQEWKLNLSTHQYFFLRLKNFRISELLNLLSHTPDASGKNMLFYLEINSPQKQVYSQLCSSTAELFHRPFFHSFRESKWIFFQFLVLHSTIFRLKRFPKNQSLLWWTHSFHLKTRRYLDYLRILCPQFSDNYPFEKSDCRWFYVWILRLFN